MSALKAIEKEVGQYLIFAYEYHEQYVDSTYGVTVYEEDRMIPYDLDVFKNKESALSYFDKLMTEEDCEHHICQIKTYF